MEKVLEKDYCRLWLNKTDGYVYMEWLGDLKGNQFPEGVAMTGRLCLENGISKMIYDDIEIGNIDFGARIKVLIETAPNLYRDFKGTKGYLAIINSQSIAYRAASKIITEALKKLIPRIEIRHFSKKEEAIEWIKNA